MKKTINIIIFGLLLLIFGSFMFTFQVRQDEVAFLSTSGSASKPFQSRSIAIIPHVTARLRDLKIAHRVHIGVDWRQKTKPRLLTGKGSA